MAFPAQADVAEDPVSWEAAVVRNRGALRINPRRPTKVPTSGAVVALTLRTAGPDGRATPDWTASASISIMPVAAERRATIQPGLSPDRHAHHGRRSPLHPAAHPCCSSARPSACGWPTALIHDGYWYASDTGGAIKGQKIDLYTGHGRGSMAAGHAPEHAHPDHRRRRPFRRLPAFVGRRPQPCSTDGLAELDQRRFALKQVISG
jgi:hypothetical protein